MIECQNITKIFKTYKKEPGFKGIYNSFFHRKFIQKKALNDFSISIPKGEFVGLLGPNGAGKTTLMKILTGIIVPSSGMTKVLGFNPSERPLNFRKKISLVMGQKFQLWWDIPPMDSFLLLQKYYEISNSRFQEKVAYLSEVLDVKDLLYIPLRKLSLGERMKLELMACLFHDPEVIFLDEPTIGLDLVAQNNLRNFLREYHETYKPTIVLTSHYMTDIKELCSHLVLVLNGSKSFDGSIEEFEGLLGPKKSVTFFFSEPMNINEPFWKDLKTTWGRRKQSVTLEVEEKDLQKISSQVLEKFSVSDFRTEKISIEKITHTLFNDPSLLDSKK